MKDYPKYKMIKDYVIDKINSKEYYADKRIPSENEFAELLGVSGITVRKAMAELVNEGLIYRVKGKGSFVSDNSSKTSNKLIALLLSGRELNDSSYMHVIMGMQKSLSAKSYSLIIECSEQDLEKEKDIILRMFEKNVDGFILYPDDPEKSIDNYKIIKKKNMPLVVVDRFTSAFPSNYVGCNNHDGAYLAVEHLINLKHKKIAFVDFEFFLNSELERFKGYCDALKSAKVEIVKDNIFLKTGLDINKIISKIKQKDITAIFAVNDRRALQLMNELISRGVRIPEDVSLVGFDDCEASKHAVVSLTTVRQNFERLGYEAAEMLVSMIDCAGSPYERRQLGAELVVRNSTSYNLDA